jgi:hypothetical protein
MSLRLRWIARRSRQVAFRQLVSFAALVEVDFLTQNRLVLRRQQIRISWPGKALRCYGCCNWTWVLRSGRRIAVLSLDAARPTAG